MKRLVAVLALATVGCTSGAEQRQEPRAATLVWRPVAEWSGRGTELLATFPIGAGRLRLHWETRNETAPGAGHFKVRLHSADSGRVLDEPVDVRGTGAGSKDVTDDHQRFYFSIESTGVDWKIRVEEGVVRSR